MRLFISILISVLFALFTSWLFPNFDVEKDAITTIYTISGILFSIGMSLCVTINLANIKNKLIRKGIHSKLDTVRNHFIYYFAIISLMYVIFLPKIKSANYIDFFAFTDKLSLNLKYSHALSFIIAYSIIYFVTNFLSIQKLTTEIEDAINRGE